MKKVSVYSIYFVIALFSVGCATIMGDKTQLVGINSNPDQAEVTITDEVNFVVFKGRTPASVNLEKSKGYFKKKEYSVKIFKEGYQDQIINLKSSVTGWYLLGNLGVGGLIGWFIVDPNNGAMYHLKPEQINAHLGKSGQQSKQSTGSLYIVLLRDVPNELKPHMKRIN